MNRIEDQEAYNNIRNYRNELRDQFKETYTQYAANRLKERIGELDSLLARAEALYPEYEENYLITLRGARVNPGTT